MVNPPDDSTRVLSRAEQLEMERELLIQDLKPKAIAALSRLAKAIGSNPGTGQRRRLTAFLGGLYNGHHYPFDLTDLRGLDGALRDACLAVLAYDSLGQREIHRWGVIESEDLVGWLKDDGHFYAAEQRQKAREMYRDRYGSEGHKPDREEA